MLVVEDLFKRDFIAIEAMKAIIAGCSNMGVVNYDATTLARSAYEMADEMMGRGAMPTKFEAMGIMPTVAGAKSPEKPAELKIDDDFPYTAWSFGGKGIES